MLTDAHNFSLVVLMGPAGLFEPSQRLTMQLATNLANVLSPLCNTSVKAFTSSSLLVVMVKMLL